MEIMKKKGERLMRIIRQAKRWWFLSLVVFLLSQGSFSYAQDVSHPDKVTVGTDLIVDGEIGIGTTSPSSFVAGPTIHLKGATPAYTFEEDDGTVDNQWWDLFANAGTFRARVISDDGLSDFDWLFVNRTGVTVDNVNFPNGNVGIGTTSPSTFVAGPNLHIKGATPAYTFEESDGTANNKFWDFFANGGQLRARAISDDGSSDVDWLTVDRTAATIDQVVFPNGNVGIGTTSPTSRRTTPTC